MTASELRDALAPLVDEFPDVDVVVVTWDHDGHEVQRDRVALKMAVGNDCLFVEAA